MHTTRFTPTTAREGERNLSFGMQWARSLYGRYHEDTYFRTEANILGLLVLSTGVVMVVIVILFFINTLLIDSAILDSYAPLYPDRATALVREVDFIRNRTLAIGLVLSLISGVLFGYLIASLALRPVRGTLNSQKHFIRNIAHEIRTPLSIIKMHSELVLLDPSIETGRGAAQSNIEEIDRVSQIIDNLLTISALAKPEKPAFTEVDLYMLTKNLSGKFSSFAGARGVQISVQEGGAALVWGNRTALEQIVRNVMKNAILYTPRGGSIASSIRKTGDGFFELLMRDTGVGIAPEDIPHIFDPFFRADSSRTRAGSGAGLGLTIVSELVKMHHGTVSIRSKVGEGTTVFIRLPCATNIKARKPSPTVNTPREPCYNDVLKK